MHARTPAPPLTLAGPLPTVAAVVLAFFFNWAFEEGYSEFTTASHDV